MYELRDYYIWKEGDTYMVRVKATGEVTPVSQEVVRVIWSTEDYERYLVKKDVKNGLTSFDVVDEDGCSLAETVAAGGNRDTEVASIENLRLVELKKGLTTVQRKVFELQFENGFSISETAKVLNVSYYTVKDSRKLILKKLRKNS